MNRDARNAVWFALCFVWALAFFQLLGEVAS